MEKQVLGLMEKQVLGGLLEKQVLGVLRGLEKTGSWKRGGSCWLDELGSPRESFLRMIHMVLNHNDILLRGLINRNLQAPKSTTNACFRQMLVLAINFHELIFEQVGVDVVVGVVGKPEISVAACSNFISTELKQLIEGVHLSLKSALKHHLHRPIVPLRGKPVGDAVEHGAPALKRGTLLIRNTLANPSNRGDSSVLKLSGFSVLKLSGFLTLIIVFKNLLRKDDL